MNELTVGQKVICKHKNGRYYQCDVVQLSKETFYEVNFDDGSFSDNLFPEDIVVFNSFFNKIIFFWHKRSSLTHLPPVIKSILSQWCKVDVTGTKICASGPCVRVETALSWDPPLRVKWFRYDGRMVWSTGPNLWQLMQSTCTW